jgi:hypothetical protein
MMFLDFSFPRRKVHVLILLTNGKLWINGDAMEAYMHTYVQKKGNWKKGRKEQEKNIVEENKIPA